MLKSCPLSVESGACDAHRVVPYATLLKSCGFPKESGRSSSSSPPGTLVENVTCLCLKGVKDGADGAGAGGGFGGGAEEEAGG